VITWPRLVGAGLVFCFLMGQAERFGHAHGTSVAHFVGILLSAVATVVIGSGACLVYYLRHGHPPWRPHPMEPVVFPGRRRAVPLEVAGGIVKLGDGVYGGPAPELLEVDGAAVLPAAPSGTAHIETPGKSEE